MMSGIRRLGNLRGFVLDYDRHVVLAFLLWRVLLYLGACMGSLIAAQNPNFAFRQPLSSLAEFLFGAWVHWDAAWYLSIIQKGYYYDGPGVQASVAFFPLYPVVVRLVLAVCGRGTDDHYAVVGAGLVVSGICALLALLVVYRLARYEMERVGVRDADRAALVSVLCLLFFPTSVFFASLYTEALFLFVSASSLYYLRRGRFLRAGFLGGLASLCRLSGIVLVLPVAIEYLQCCGFKLRREAVAVLLVPLGTGLYCLYLYIVFQEPVAFLLVQNAPGWHGAIQGVPFSRSLDNVLDFVLHPLNVWRFLELTYSFGALALAFLGLRRLRLALGIYAVAACLVPLAADTWSIQRYILGAFPIFITLGYLVRSGPGFFVLIASFIFMLGINTVMWINGIWLG
jgi:hypothetical protein